MRSQFFHILVAATLVTSLGCKEKPPEVVETEPTTEQAVAEPSEAAEPAEEAADQAAVAPAEDSAPTDLGALQSPDTLTETAPDKFSVKVDTTAGEFTIDLTRAWAPNGVDRFYNLVSAGYYTDIAAFRVIDGFMAQFGIHGNPEINKIWQNTDIPDDPAVTGISNTEGYLTFATRGPNTRTVQLFINFGNNAMLDSQGFRPIGKVAGDGMKVVNSWYKGYGEGAPRGRGPDQGRMQAEGNSYLRQSFPELTYIKSITLVEGGAQAAEPAAKPDRPAAPARSWTAGSFSGKDITGGGVEGGDLRVSVGDSGSVTGAFQGRREGSAFSVPFKGTIDDTGNITAEGARGTNNVKVTGRLQNGKFSGTLQGDINKQGYRLSVSAQ